MSILRFTVLTSDLKALSPLTAGADTRFYLKGVLVEATEKQVLLVATNGAALGALRVDVKVDGGAGMFIIPCELLERIKPIHGATLSVVSYDTETGLVTVDQGTTQQSAKALDGKFPDWRRVVPRECNGEAAQFNPTFIAQFAKVSTNLGWKRGTKSPVMLINHNGQGGALVSVPDERFIGVVMPFRLNDSPLPIRPTRCDRVKAVPLAGSRGGTRMNALIGRYFVEKYRQRAAAAGVQAVAAQLRKQGVDVRVAVAILARRGAA